MNSVSNTKDFSEEKAKLARTIDTMQEGIVIAQDTAKNLIEEMRKFNPATDNIGLFYAMETSENICRKRISDYKRNMDKPYFASIEVEFKDEKEHENKLYIGKCGVISNHGVKLEVIDWRTPIASLYYDGRVGKVSYEAPEGVVECILNNKRIYTIEEGKLIEYMDVDITSNDELLKPYLEASSDNRLKNIISTIQAEQNKIIRAKLGQPIIVQGVAGSGKTTAALHRIAYLVYENEKTLKPDDFMIIAPNKVFLDYISEVLPDLGVDNVKQVTFEQFAEEYLELKYKLRSSNEVLLQSIEEFGPKSEELKAIANFKSSLEYKDIIDRYLEQLYDLSLPEGEIKIADVTILDEKTLKKMFREVCSFDHLSLDDNFKRFLLKLSYFIEMNHSKIERAIVERRTEKLDELKKKNLTVDEFRKKKIEIYDEYEYYGLLEKNGKRLIAQYSKKRKRKTALHYYNTFIDKLEEFLQAEDARLIECIKKNHKSSKGILDIEDLPALMYIKKRLDGKCQKDMAKHIVIDEAQDYSPFQLYMLKEILQNNSMTILGDIAQGIHSYRGISDWEYINEKIFDGKANIVILNKSYRTTMEIMNLGNRIIDTVESKSEFVKAVPVIRTGKPVKIDKVKNFNEMICSVAEVLKNLDTNKNNIAIITKNISEARKVHKALSSMLEFDIQMITESVKDYRGGIIVIPSYLSKGLEFDSVIITDASEKSYKNNEMDAKLLYVAITRAMHTLNVFYEGNLTPLIS